MKITKVDIITEDIPLRQKFVTARRSLDTVRSIGVVMHTDGGITGYGACAPTPVITGDTEGSILYALEKHLLPLVTGAELSPELLPAVGGCLMHNTSPKAAVDIALHDLLAKEAGVPLFEYLGGCGGEKHLITDATVSLGTPEGMAEQALKHVRDGFSVLKVKLGGSREEDIARTAALKKTLPDGITLRIDANQGWSPEDAIYIISYIAGNCQNAELVEQPVWYEDIEGMAYVTARSPIRILADESASTPAEARRVIKEHAAHMLNIKLMKCGGIYEASKIARDARENGMECLVGCMMEGAASVTAAAHFAAAYGITKTDLDAPLLCGAQSINGDFCYSGENIRLGISPGLGI